MYTAAAYLNKFKPLRGKDFVVKKFIAWNIFCKYINKSKYQSSGEKLNDGIWYVDSEEPYIEKHSMH